MLRSQNNRNKSEVIRYRTLILEIVKYSWFFIQQSKFMTSQCNGKILPQQLKFP